MIYLRPLGGLCNRMRSIESLITLTESYKEDLTVLWVMDAALNSAFHDIFKPIKSLENKVRIIDCPIGFPEHYYRGKKGAFKRKIKDALKGRLLNQEQKVILETLESLPDDLNINGRKFADVYDAKNKKSDRSIREMDKAFIEEIEPFVSELFTNSAEEKFISSCYRLVALKNSYEIFEPVDGIKERIARTTGKFGKKTIGLHIRRTDHTTSKEFSTTDKFVAIIENYLNEDNTTNFFLCTDDGPTKQGLIDLFGDKIIVNEVTSYDRNNSDAVKDAVVDLYCLSNTNMIYGSHHSSFSQTAADIGNIPDTTAK